jgi:hypothetical protein
VCFVVRNRQLRRVSSLRFQRKIEIECQANTILLLVRTFASIVLMLVVKVELDMFVSRECAACIESRRAPFLVRPT